MKFFAISLIINYALTTQARKIGMKKLISSVALALAVFGFVPSGFCAPKAKSPLHSKNSKTTKPKKETKKEKKSQKDDNKKIIVKKTVFYDTSFPKNKTGNYLLAPKTKVLYDYALQNKLNIEVVELPEINEICSGAFSGCKNLKKVILGNDLHEVCPTAFNKCNPDLKIIYKGQEHSFLQFFKQYNWPIFLKKEREYLSKKIFEDIAKRLAMQTQNPASMPSCAPATMANFSNVPTMNLMSPFGFRHIGIFTMSVSNPMANNGNKINTATAEERTVIESSIED